MYAVIQASGRQYRVSEGDVIVLQRQSGKAGDTIEFPKVVLVENDGNVRVGESVKTAKVTGRILSQGTGKKLRTYRFRKHKNTQKTVGHRPKVTKVSIEKIQA
jgi:large subunit ribosomal protein L21